MEAARLRGVGPAALVLRHILPNALIPAIAVMALTLAGLMTGVVVIEVAFNYPGLGRLTMNAVYDRDLPLVLGVSMVLAAIYLGLGLLADLVTLAVDPRCAARSGGDDERGRGTPPPHRPSPRVAIPRERRAAAFGCDRARPRPSPRRVALGSPWIVPYDPTMQDPNAMFSGPSPSIGSAPIRSAATSSPGPCSAAARRSR